MKTNILRFALLGLLALVAAMGCQRESVMDDNPDYNPETKEVTTQFVLNVTAAPQTRMTATVAQQNQNFRGIQNVKLYCYKTGMAPDNTPYVISTATSDKQFDLGLFAASGSLDNSSTVDNTTTPATTHNANEESSSRRVLQLSIPVGVDAVLFYGKAIKASGDSDEDFGATNTNATVISGNPSSTVIAAKKILNETNVTSYDQTAALMIAVINDLLACNVPSDVDATFGNLPAVSWAQYGHQYERDKIQNPRYAASLCLGHTLTGLEEVLGKCYYLFTYILPPDTNPWDATENPEEFANWKPIRPNGEYRAGSSAAVKTMVMDMYKVITAAASTTPTNANEANAKRLSEYILDRALLYFYNTDSSADSEIQYEKGDYKSNSFIKTVLVGYKIVTENEWNTKYGQATDLNGYPYEEFGVPEGAAQLGFHVQGATIPEGETGAGGTYAKDEFYYYHPNKPLVNPTMTEFEPKKYLYPAELWYYTNSAVRTTTGDVTINSYPNGVTPWNTFNWAGNNWTTPGKVSGDTRGVAVVNSINYGVALLKSSVEFYPSDITQFEDNRYELTNHAEANKVIYRSAAQLELRGILVGGVNPRMNWQFIRKYPTAAAGAAEDLGDLSLFDGVIYDHSLASNNVPTTLPNYTLVYDNYNSSESDSNQNDVYVSLEFVNKGEPFYGRDNLIPSGGVFYLVAKLEKPTIDQINSFASKWPTDHQIPPIWGADGETVASPAVAGQSKKIPRIFIQDFMTSVVFKIGATSLQNAYYSVPDLRASQMSLGLSVDLQWIPGLSYEKLL